MRSRCCGYFTNLNTLTLTLYNPRKTLLRRSIALPSTPYLIMDESSIVMARLCSFAYRFPLPVTQLLRFQDYFRRYMPPKGDSLTPFPTALRISQLDKSRNDMAHELASGAPNYANGIAGAKQYVSLIAQCIYSLENSPEPVMLDKQLSFTWATGIGENPRSSFISNSAFIWDKIMALSSQAFCLTDAVCGRDVAHVGPEIGYPMAGRVLREAAGIFEHLRREELPRWIGETAKKERLPEAHEFLCQGLAIFCLGEAQAMATAKAISDGQARHSVVAKLCLGVACQMEECYTVLRSKGGIMYEKIDRPFLTHITFVIQLFKAIAHKFFSDDAWLSDKFGLSIRHLREAIDMLKIRKDAMARGVPELEGPLMAVANDVRQLRGVITNLLQERSNDNGNIYFDPIPSELEALQEGTYMMKAIAYEPTELHAWKFVPMSELMKTYSSVTEPSVASSTSESQLPPPSDVGNEKNDPSSSDRQVAPSGESQTPTLEVAEELYCSDVASPPSSAPTAPTVEEQ